jgi:hypothetical protein
MYMNHVECFRRLVSVLRTDMNKHPVGWQFHPPTWPLPDWLPAVEAGLQKAEEETCTAYFEIKKMRELVSDKDDILFCF